MPLRLRAAKLDRLVYVVLWTGFFLSIMTPPIAMASQVIPERIEVQSMVEVRPSKAFFRPGEAVDLELVWPAGQCRAERASVEIWSLAERAASLEVTGHAEDSGWCRAHLRWTPPARVPSGYGVDVRILDGNGREVAEGHGAFDVLARWTQAPRYGFLTDFSPGRQDVENVVDGLARYHINGLQFYDWMYRHDDLLTDAEPYRDPLGRWLARETVEKFIEAAHARSMAAMAYAAVYAASPEFYRQHPDWALRDASGRAIPFGNNFLYIMDPREGSPWTAHLLGQFEEALRRLGFDGVHVDQYGDPKWAYDAEGHLIDLAPVMREFIDLAKRRATGVRDDATVVFNAVNNWPMDEIARSSQDFVYIEVWPPNLTYRSLWSLIEQGQRLSGGKPVVLAAYIDPSRVNNVRLADAVIFASGGSHIELGETVGMLADPYFPKYRPVSAELAEALKRYYDFAVRYQEVLALGSKDVTVDRVSRVRVNGVSVDPWTLRAAPQPGAAVMPILRESSAGWAVNLVNFSGVDDLRWNGDAGQGPQPVGPLRLRFYTEDPVAGAWAASPDGPSPAAQPLALAAGQDQVGRFVEVELPTLYFWTVLVFQRCTAVRQQ